MRKEYQVPLLGIFSNDKLRHLFFYGFTAAAITLCLVPIHIIFLAKRWMSLVTSSIISFVMMWTWAAQISFWFHCELGDANFGLTPKWCPTSTDPRYVGQAKPMIGVFVVTIFAIISVLSAAAAWKERRERKCQSLPIPLEIRQ